MLGVGIIGLGHIAAHQIAALDESGTFQLIAACDTDSATFASLDRSVRTFFDVDDMLTQSELSVVVVSSPNDLHIEHGIKVMESGKWLVMEKPLAGTRREFQIFAETRARLSARCSLALHAAFGVETEWFFGDCDRKALGCEEISSFSSGFYDPYFCGGILVRPAKSLGGSWIDSGINALSVICRLIAPQCLQIRDSRMSRVRNTGCTEVQGTVEFDFHHQFGHGIGSIDTNWTLGRNRKTTLLSIAGVDRQIVLDHSEQTVAIRENGSDTVIFSCDNDRPRLTNHYIGVFRDLANQIGSQSDNFDYCTALHKILFDADEWPIR